MMRLVIACWWEWVRRPGEDLGRGRQEVEFRELSWLSAVVFTSVLASSSLSEPESLETEIRGDVGDRSMCSLSDPSETWPGGSEGD
jgi:hypothetical protein